MSKLGFNSIPTSVFEVSSADVRDNNDERAKIVGAGRLLTYEYAKKGHNALNKIKNNGVEAEPLLSATKYKQLNEKFQAEHFLFAAKLCCAQTGQTAPKSYDEFKRTAATYYNNGQFWAVLQGIYEEIITPIIPAIYSEAVSVFADVISVGFAETASITIGSDDIPIFQDTAWGAQRSIPHNRFYEKEYNLNPAPKSCTIVAKWTQLVGNGMDFGKWFVNITAGMYAKTMGMWNQAMTLAAADTTLIPSGLSVTFGATNWVTLANKISALNNTPITNLVGIGNAVALSKVLPTGSTGSTNVNMDAALATLLGADYIRSGYLGEYMGVRLMPITDAVVPNTQHGQVATVLDSSKIWMMAGNGRKPLTIAINTDSPITFEINPTRSANFEIGINMTFAMDSVAVFSSKVGLVTI